MQIGVGPVRLEFQDQPPGVVYLDKLVTADDNDERILVAGRIETNDEWFCVRIVGELGDDHFYVELPNDLNMYETDEYGDDEEANRVLSNANDFDRAYTAVDIEPMLS